MMHGPDFFLAQPVKNQVADPTHHPAQPSCPKSVAHEVRTAHLL